MTIYKSSNVKLHSNIPVYSEEFVYKNAKVHPIHAHEFYEIGITLGGTACHHFADTTHPLLRGSVYLIPIGQSHGISKTNDWQVQNLYFIPTITFLTQASPLSSSALFSSFFMNLLHKKTDQIIHLELSPSSLNETESLINSYKAIKLSNVELMDHYKQNCLLNLLMILCDAYYTQTDSPLPIMDLRIPKLLTIIEANLELATSDLLVVIANSLSLHPQYINKLVKSSLGTTLSSLIMDSKIKHSCEMLLTRQPITDISLKLGFFDHAHYHKNFVKYFGISPSQFRKNQM